MLRPLARLALLPLLWLGTTLPASAAVTVTFWSHEFNNSFPHAFITLRGAPDKGGRPVDMNIGFTAKHISPAILFGKVAGMLEPGDLNYVKGSDAHFSMVLTDDQYVTVLGVLKQFGPGGDQVYDLNRHNCVHFTQAVAAALGLAGTDQPKLMKKPTSFLDAVEAANAGRVTPVDKHGKEYVATLQPVPGLDPRLPVLAATGAPTPELAFSDDAGAVPMAPGAVITADSMNKGKKAPAAADASPAPTGSDR
jgi:hypothetical protein